MPERAHVSSVDALEAFRSALIIYLSKARPALDEVNAEVMRTRVWLQEDQRTHWENELRRRARSLQEAQQALFSAKLSSFREATSVEQLIVHRSKRAFDEADGKLRVIKKWKRDYDNRVEPLLKQMEKLHSVLSHDMGMAIAYLTKAIDTLHSYAGTAVAPAAPPSTPAPTEGPTSDLHPAATPAAGPGAPPGERR
ncbi:MAG TPA: hypothetical protein VMU04_01310 [Candidatus Acidoferrum sp.]|nr:hypothetical protein [Candidatus Acidoferrum sp.]